MPIAYCLLPIAYCLLPIAFPSWEGLGVGSYCLLPLASCLRNDNSNKNPIQQ
ncbi:hypothetical protein BJP36_37700 [Moorena producens JHB]|uniref:Uncharacterized protein n=1 Tax=Moorena producens (strain JHB) TaxID=1454205 RepID=A0A9Q9UWF0_MOOP1|nr:hypothetical protein [Moorena producens]WAN69831.1 hypothetical protein BJP36_37700 [Moorena producens JHB]